MVPVKTEVKTDLNKQSERYYFRNKYNSVLVKRYLANVFVILTDKNGTRCQTELN